MVARAEAGGGGDQLAAVGLDGVVEPDAPVALDRVRWAWRWPVRIQPRTAVALTPSLAARSPTVISPGRAGPKSRLGRPRCAEPAASTRQRASTWSATGMGQRPAE